MKFETKRNVLNVFRCLVAYMILFLVFAFLNLEWSLLRWTWSSIAVFATLSTWAIYNILNEK